MTKLTRLIRDTRPRPPEMSFASFVPAPELEAWARRTFIDEEAPLCNPEHEHLRSATIGFLWTNIAATRNGKAIAGQCEVMPPMAMGKWQRERAMFQILGWFGEMPDFLITLHAPYCEHVADDASFCALVEHELCHAGQEKDAFGVPKFSRDTGLPKFAVRAHDVEQFVSVVERYGHHAAGVTEMIEAARRGPTIGEALIGAACGTCGRKAA